MDGRRETSSCKGSCQISVKNVHLLIWMRQRRRGYDTMETKVKFTLTPRIKFVQYLNHKTLQELVRQWERQYAVSHCLHAANSTNTIFSEERWADRNLFSSKLFISSLWGSDKAIGIIIQTSTVTFRGRVGADRLQRRCVFLSIEVKEYLSKGAWEFTFVLFNAKKYQQVEKQQIRKFLNGRCWEG